MQVNIVLAALQFCVFTCFAGPLTAGKFKLQLQPFGAAFLSFLAVWTLGRLIEPFPIYTDGGALSSPPSQPVFAP